MSTIEKHRQAVVELKRIRETLIELRKEVSDDHTFALMAEGTIAQIHDLESQVLKYEEKQ